VRGGSVVAEVQQELARAGYYRGSIDGVVGNGTRNAIRAYERANRLRVDGRIDQELLRSLRLG
jgi:peptidoglycan hydrolase-like protein with peptidoglycan-binding domain